MSTPPPKEEQLLSFENGNSAKWIQVSPDADAAVILSKLNISKSQAVFVLCGSTIKLGTKVKNRLQELISRGVAKAAVDTEALIIDGGTRAGVIELMGKGVEDRGRKTILIGVSPIGKVKHPQLPDYEDSEDNVALDPNHSHFVLVENDQWGSETKTMFELARFSSEDENKIITILAGGNPEGVALDEALATVRNNWPLLVIEGSGRLADEIIDLLKYKETVNNRKGRIWRLLSRLPGLNGLTKFNVRNPELSEIVHDGNIMVFPKNENATKLRNLLNNLINPPAPPEKDLLWMAWKRFAEYDVNSLRHRDIWHRLKTTPLVLGVISTLLVLIYSAPEVRLITEEQNILWGNIYNSLMNNLNIIPDRYPLLDLAFRFLIILMPISTSIILGVETQFKLGSKYIYLRGAAESIKRGIYSFRTLNKIKTPANHLPSNEQELANHLENVSKILLDSDVNEAAFKPYDGSIPPSMYGAEAYDDGRSDLKPDEYIRIRIGDQLGYFTSRTNQFEKRLRNLRIWVLVLGGVGTFLAAIGAQYWLPLTAALVSAMTALLEYRQIEQHLIKYNLTKSSLENTLIWWESLSPDQRNDNNIYTLVLEVETILESENQGWVQYVKQAQDTQKTASQVDTATNEI